MTTHHHDITSRKRLVWTILLNVIITTAEFVGGFLSGYLALIADGVHNLSDVAALILAWIGTKGSELPATKRSTYGLKRLEVMTALISAISLVVIAAFVFYAAAIRLMHPPELGHPWLFLGVAIVGFLGNGISVALLFAEKDHSLNMKTAFLHLAFDTVSSLAVIIGGIVIMMTGWVMLDALLSILIGLAILWSSYQVIKEGVLILLEATPAGIDFDEVHSAILSVASVRDVHDLHIWSLSSREIALSCHACVDAKDYANGPQTIGAINSLLAERFGIGHGTIQLEIEECANGDLLCRFSNSHQPHHHKH
jgi:cobalt-zinc-cadmium efflux system protein